MNPAPPQMRYWVRSYHQSSCRELIARFGDTIVCNLSFQPCRQILQAFLEFDTRNVSENVPSLRDVRKAVPNIASAILARNFRIDVPSQRTGNTFAEIENRILTSTRDVKHVRRRLSDFPAQAGRHVRRHKR